MRANAFAEAGGVGDTCRVKLDDYLDSFEQVLDHPRHRAAQESLVELIRQLRACTNVDEGYEFQQALLSQVLAVEEDHHAFNRAVKRMASGKSPQAGAPEPQSGLDPSLPSTWQLELDICERVARQFRCVGDALAWRVFGFERQYITALARNQSPGVMAGKLGLAAERARVEKAWKEDGQFALMHDLTNCLRIGDITVFGDEAPEQIEVKTNAKRRNSVQNRRIKAARRALGVLARCPGMTAANGCTTWTCPTGRTWICSGSEPSALPRRGSSPPRCAETARCWWPTSTAARLKAGLRTSSRIGWNANSAEHSAGPG